MIEVNGGVKRFGATLAVDGVSFQVEEGKILGFLGPNGAGKSTTMKVLTTYLVPDQGDAKLLDRSVLEDPFGVRQLVGAARLNECVGRPSDAVRRVLGHRHVESHYLAEMAERVS